MSKYLQHSVLDISNLGGEVQELSPGPAAGLTSHDAMQVSYTLMKQLKMASSEVNVAIRSRAW